MTNIDQEEFGAQWEDMTPPGSETASIVPNLTATTVLHKYFFDENLARQYRKALEESKRPSRHLTQTLLKIPEERFGLAPPKPKLALSDQNK